MGQCGPDVRGHIVRSFGHVPEADGVFGNEMLEEVNDELLRRAKSLPQFRERVFIFGEGPLRARAAVVGESPGPPDIDSGRPFMGPAADDLDDQAAELVQSAVDGLVSR